jgi:lipid-A-disaccharide synthase-like uncharacterized protein
MAKIIQHILGILSLGGALIGSYLIASNTQQNVVGYTFFLISSIASVFLLLRQKDRSWYMIVQSIYFTGVNVYGLYNYS